MDTNLLYKEKKALRRFLLLYGFLFITIFLMLGIGYFQTQKTSMLNEIRPKLNGLANTQIQKLKSLHVNIDKTKIYPRNQNFKSGIYDLSQKKIFSLLSQKPQLDEIIYEQDDSIFYVKELQAYYLGAKYLVLEIEDDKKWLYKIYSTFLYLGIPLAVLFLVFGYFLLRLFLRPLKDAIGILDRFIKDTTHELNTPISAILSNIEMIDESSLDEKNKIKFKRINIGARTVSNLYQDLVYVSLGHKIASKDELVSLKELVSERLEYFSISLSSKDLHVEKELTRAELLVDRAKITKLIDNLISNAIKYNRKGGMLHVKLQKNSLLIANEGKTMPKEKISQMFERYQRGDEEVGGFGIGLHIVAMVAREYNLKIQVYEYKKGGTCVKLSW